MCTLPTPCPNHSCRVEYHCLCLSRSGIVRTHVRSHTPTNLYLRIRLHGLARSCQLAWHADHSALRLCVLVQGTMNGLVAMLGAVAGMIAPVVGSEFFAWSIRPEVGMPYLTHWGLAGLCLCPIIVSYSMPARLLEGPPA